MRAEDQTTSRKLDPHLADQKHDRMGSKPKVLIVDDELDVRTLVAFHLERDGFDVLTSADGENGLKLAQEFRPELIILDIMLPGISGWEVCQLIKRHAQLRQIPVLMLSAKSALENKLQGFMAGAEDYLCKPFSPRELILRVQALRRRTGAAVKDKTIGVIHIPPSLTFDFTRYRFFNAETELKFSPKEIRILKHLLERRGAVVPKEELLRDIWGEDVFVELGNIDVHIRHLREKIEADPARPRCIVTVRGVGYRFEDL